MPLLTSNIQNQYHTLVGEYSELSQGKDPRGQGVGNAMLAFISMVNETFKETYIFGFISHWDLVLNPVDTWKRSDIIVSAFYNENEKTVEYLIQHGPYRFRRPHACPHPSWYWSPKENKANSLSEAKKYLIFAMSKHISWLYSKELKQLVNSYDKK